MKENIYFLLLNSPLEQFDPWIKLLLDVSFSSIDRTPDSFWIFHEEQLILKINKELLYLYLLDNYKNDDAFVFQLYKEYLIDKDPKAKRSFDEFCHKAFYYYLSAEGYKYREGKTLIREVAHNDDFMWKNIEYFLTVDDKKFFNNFDLMVAFLRDEVDFASVQHMLVDSVSWDDYFILTSIKNRIKHQLDIDLFVYHLIATKGQFLIDLGIPLNSTEDDFIQINNLLLRLSLTYGYESYIFDRLSIFSDEHSINLLRDYLDSEFLELTNQPQPCYFHPLINGDYKPWISNKNIVPLIKHDDLVVLKMLLNLSDRHQIFVNIDNFSVINYLIEKIITGANRETQIKVSETIREALNNLPDDWELNIPTLNFDPKLKYDLYFNRTLNKYWFSLHK